MYSFNALYINADLLQYTDNTHVMELHNVGFKINYLNNINLIFLKQK